MPGKVNPVIPEVVLQVGAQVIGNDTAITVGGLQGQFELNVRIPLMARNLLQSIQILANASGMFAEKCVDGIEANLEGCERSAEGTLAVATALNPFIGYDRAAEIVKDASKSGGRCARSRASTASTRRRSTRRSTCARSPRARADWPRSTIDASSTRRRGRRRASRSTGRSRCSFAGAVAVLRAAAVGAERRVHGRRREARPRPAARARASPRRSSGCRDGAVADRRGAETGLDVPRCRCSCSTGRCGARRSRRRDPAPCSTPTIPPCPPRWAVAEVGFGAPGTAPGPRARRARRARPRRRSWSRCASGSGAASA